jgi:hypothetical protein
MEDNGNKHIWHTFFFLYSFSRGDYGSLHCMKMTAFYDIAPCSLVGVDPLFRGAYCLHHQGDDELPP